MRSSEPDRVAPAVDTAEACVVPNPRASVTDPSRPRCTFAVCSTLPPVAEAVGVNVWAESSCVSPSLAVPTNPLLAAVNGRSARRARKLGTA